jgi:hypothetical protein
VDRSDHYQLTTLLRGKTGHVGVNVNVLRSFIPSMFEMFSNVSGTCKMAVGKLNHCHNLSAKLIERF